jgi:hypothetical protein
MYCPCGFQAIINDEDEDEEGAPQREELVNMDDIDW